jgi:hypothetical protein
MADKIHTMVTKKTLNMAIFIYSSANESLKYHFCVFRPVKMTVISQSTTGNGEKNRRTNSFSPPQNATRFLIVAENLNTIYKL